MGRKLISIIFVALFVAGFFMVTNQAMAAEEKKPEQFVGILAYRTGPFAAGGSGWSSGLEDFMALVNMRGGINGKIMYKWEECETAYNTARGVECYNRFRDRMAKVHPLSTGITYALIPKGTKVLPIFTDAKQESLIIGEQFIFWQGREVQICEFIRRRNMIIKK